MHHDGPWTKWDALIGAGLVGTFALACWGAYRALKAVKEKVDQKLGH